MSQHPVSTEHNYPHQGHLEPVAPEALAEDLTSHPDAYHPDLVTNHIAPYLAKNGIDLSDMSLDEDATDLAYEVLRKVDHWKEGDALFTEADAYLLLDEQLYGVIATNFNKFTQLHKYFAHVLIDMGYGQAVATHLEAFTDLDEEIASELLENGYSNEFLKGIKYFKDYTTRDMLEALIKHSKAHVIVTNLDAFTDMSHNEIAHRLIEQGRASALAEFIDNFDNLDGSVAYGLIDARHLRVVMGHFDRFTNLDSNQVAYHLMAIDKAYDILHNLADFEALDDEITYYLANAGYGDMVLDNIERFKPFDYQILFDRMIDGHQPEVVLKNLHRIPGVDHTRIALKMIATRGLGGMVVQNLDKFPNVNRPRIFDALRAEGYYTVIVQYFDKFEGLGIDQMEFVRDTIRHRYAIEVVYNLSKFHDLNHPIVAQEMIDAGYGYMVLTHYDKFRGLDDMDVVSQVLKADIMDIRFIPPALLDRVKKNRAFYELVKERASQVFMYDEDLHPDKVAAKSYSRIAKILKPGDDEIIDLNSELFGAMASVTTARMVYGIMRSEQPPTYVSEIGITQIGQEGIEQLKALMEPIVREINTGELSPETERRFAESELLKKVLMSYTGYSSARWGGSDADELTVKLEYRALALKDGRINSEMRPGYEPSERYQITMGDNVTEFTEDVIDRYHTLIDGIRDADYMLEAQDGFTEIVKSIQSDIDGIIGKLKGQMVGVDETDEKAQHLDKRIKSLQQYLTETREAADGRFVVRVLKSPADFERGIVELAAYPALHEKIRTLTFAWAMRKNPRMNVELLNLPDRPTIKSISAVREFVEHIVNQETYGDYFSDKRSLGVFKRITSVRALDEAMVRYNKEAKKSGTISDIQFVPTRGLLLDMSGQIANACWADVNDSLAEDRPNFTAIIMREAPNEIDERIVGAALMIETSDPKTGEGVLLLRGVNPVEDYINEVDVAGFYRSITDFVRKTAKRRGLKPAIVIDNHAGGSGTNRSVLHDYLMTKRSELKSQRVDYATTYFNGYDVTHTSFAL